MLFMMRNTWFLNALPCSLCGIVILLCSALLRVPCSCLCGSKTLWGWHTTLWIVLMPLVPCLMLLMTHHPHLHQPANGWIDVIHSLSHAQVAT